MYFEQIHPFIRYVRYLEFNENTKHPLQIPYDARLFYTYKGTGAIKADDNMYTLDRGDMILINSDVPYRFYSAGTVGYLAVNFDYTYNHFTRRFPIIPSVPGESYRPENVLEHISFKDAPALDRVIHIKSMFETEEILLSMENIFRQKPLYYNNTLSTLMTDILTKCLTSGDAPAPGKVSRSEEPSQIIKYIHANYNKDISNSMIGDLFGYHPNYVSVVVKNYTGMPLHGYILFVRISNAINLLDSTRMSVAQIAEEVGFSSVSRFSNHFKKITGVNPSEYRRTINS